MQATATSLGHVFNPSVKITSVQNFCSAIICGGKRQRAPALANTYYIVAKSHRLVDACDSEPAKHIPSLRPRGFWREASSLHHKPMQSSPRTRMRGACRQCARYKRKVRLLKDTFIAILTETKKCDHQWPQCSGCLKRNEACEPRTWKFTDRLSRGRHSQRKRVEVSCNSGQVDRSIRGPQQLGGPQGPQFALIQSSSGPDCSQSGDITAMHRSLDHADFISTNGATSTRHGAEAMQSSGHSPADWDTEIDCLSMDVLSTCSLQWISVLSPWHSELLRSAPRRFLWEYFVHLTNTSFLCFDREDLQAITSFKDPFLETLPVMALSNPLLGTAALCFSAFQYEYRNPDHTISLSGKSLAKEAAQVLFSTRRGNAADDAWLLPTIAAGVLLHLPQIHEAQNFLQLARSAAAYLVSLSTPSYRSRDQIFQTVMSLLRWADISTLCSLCPPEQPFNADIHSMLEMQEEETQNNFAPEFYGWVTHPIFAFSPRLINPLLRIGRAMRLQTRHHRKQAAQPPLQGSTHEEAYPTLSESPVVENAQILLLEEELRLARDGDTETEAHRTSRSSGGRSDNTADPAPLICLNEAMHAAARIVIDSRLRRLPFTAPSIREHVDRVVRETSKTTDASRVSHALAFPLFVAGCEAVDTAARETIASRLA